MSLGFRQLCELFEQLAEAHVRGKDTATTIVQTWFREHDRAIPREHSQALALISCLLPARRADRVCGLQPARLRTIIQKAQGLGSSRMRELQRWQSDRGLDFASAVEKVLSATSLSPNPSSTVMIDDVDEALDQIAAVCPFSSPEIRQGRNEEPSEAPSGLTRLFCRADSLQAKWLVRLVQKDLRPAIVPEIATLKCFHVSLPDCLAVRSSLRHALQPLNDPDYAQLLSQSVENGEYTSVSLAAPQLKPQLGVMVGLPSFEKARSIEHCCQLVGKYRASVEQKYDGEYCQVHVSVLAGTVELQIFSKTGRDSTKDRVDIHDAIKRCLRIDNTHLLVKQQYIFVGELLAWNEQSQTILPFYKIRTHVLRAGHRIGCAQDYPPSRDEHLMIMLYDVLLYGDIDCLCSSYASRRQRLDTLVQPLPGRVDIGASTEIDFKRPDATHRLRHMMQTAIELGWEGLVLKLNDECYLSPRNRPWQIKLKKDYIPGRADSADLVVIGGRRDPKLAQTWEFRNLLWTTFHLACLVTHDRREYSDTRLIFQIVGPVTRPCLSMIDLRHLNRVGTLCQTPFTPHHDLLALRSNLCRADFPTELFWSPTVVEVIGAGFDRPSNGNFFSLRFPRIVKIHEDRSIQDALDFDEYQRLALESIKGLGECISAPTESAPPSLSTKTVPISPRISGPCIGSLNQDHSSTSDKHIVSGCLSDTTVADNTNLADRRCALKRKTAATTSSRFCKKMKGSRGRSNHGVEPSTTNTVSSSSLPLLDSYSMPCPLSHSKARSSPMLVHESAAKHFLEPDRRGSQMLSKKIIKVTFDINWFTCNDLGPDHKVPPKTGNHFDVVFVDWNQSSIALTDMQSVVAAFRHHQDISISSGARRILFVDWRALELFGTAKFVRWTVFTEHVQAYMIYENGKVQSVVYGEVDWTYLLAQESR